MCIFVVVERVNVNGGYFVCLRVSSAGCIYALGVIINVNIH